MRGPYTRAFFAAGSCGVDDESATVAAAASLRVAAVAAVATTGAVSVVVVVDVVVVAAAGFGFLMPVLRPPFMSATDGVGVCCAASASRACCSAANAAASAVRSNHHKRRTETCRDKQRQESTGGFGSELLGLDLVGRDALHGVHGHQTARRHSSHLHLRARPRHRRNAQIITDEAASYLGTNALRSASLDQLKHVVDAAHDLSLQLFDPPKYIASASIDV